MKLANVNDTNINPATSENQDIIASGGISYLMKYDEGATYTYIGNAVPGTATSSALWRIKRLTNADNTIVYADGNSNFDNSWNDRVSLSYS